MVLILIAVGIFILGCAESALITLGVIAQSRGYAKLSAILSFINVTIWFVTIKLAIELSLLLFFPYALAFSVGTYIAVKHHDKIRRLWSKNKRRRSHR